MNALRDFVYQAMHKWRQRLNERGLIAWPLRPTAKLNPGDRTLLFNAWKLLAVECPGLQGLNDIDSTHGIDGEAVAAILQRINLPGRFFYKSVLLLEKACASIKLSKMIALTFQIDLFPLFFFWYNDSAIIL